jgi:hypothetical protein
MGSINGSCGPVVSLGNVSAAGPPVLPMVVVVVGGGADV